MSILADIIKRFPHEADWLEAGKRFSEMDEKACPKCGSKNYDYGNVTIPPLFIQAMDEAREVTRIYESERYFCETCHGFWDVVIKDEIACDK